jgi:hypothetical protein
MLPVALCLGCCCGGTRQTRIGQFIHEHSFPYIRSVRFSVSGVPPYVRVYGWCVILQPRSNALSVSPMIDV